MDVKIKRGRRILSGKEQERMARNGWEMIISKRGESDDDLIERAIKMGYTDIRLYRATTYVRGYYNTFAFAK